MHYYFVVIFFFCFFFFFFFFSNLIVGVEASGAINIFDKALYVFGFGHYTWKVEVISTNF